MGNAPKARVLFVCFGNANRSQLAEAFARIHGGDRVEAYSAGVRSAPELDERAVATMSKRGYDLATHRPKDISELPQIEYDAVVTMGCEEQCPTIAARHHVSWNLPQGKTVDEYSLLCDAIEDSVRELLRQFHVSAGNDVGGGNEASARAF
jgi:protein-tyrosine-phosphatase